MSDTAPSARTRVKRMPERGAYEQQQLYDILDEGLVAHVALVQENLPLNIPMGYARRGNQLLFHGSISSRLMKVSRMPPVILYVLLPHLHQVVWCGFSTASCLVPCQPALQACLGSLVQWQQS